MLAARMSGAPLRHSKRLAFLHQRGRRTVGEITIRLGPSMPTASVLIDCMVEEGLVERASNPAGRGQVLVSLTQVAEGFGARIRSTRRAHQVRLAVEPLAPQHRPIFVRSLPAVLTALRRERAELGDTIDYSSNRASMARRREG